jgi:hypothetical protein
MRLIRCNQLDNISGIRTRALKNPQNPLKFEKDEPQNFEAANILLTTLQPIQFDNYQFTIF